jgi:hypothetical protein
MKREYRNGNGGKEITKVELKDIFLKIFARMLNQFGSDLKDLEV